MDDDLPLCSLQPGRYPPLIRPVSDQRAPVPAVDLAFLHPAGRTHLEGRQLRGLERRRYQDRYGPFDAVNGVAD